MEIRKASFMLIALLLIIPACLAAQIVTELPQLQKPSFITTRGDRLYVVEETALIHIFEKKEGRYVFLKTFGNAGEGPGEFGGYIHRIQVKPDHLEIPTHNRLARFDFDGRFLDEIRLPITVFKNSITRLGRNFVTRNWQVDKKKGLVSSIRLYGPDFKLIRELASRVIMKDPEHFYPIQDFCRYLVDGETCYVVHSSAESSFAQVLNTKGEETRIIHLPIEGETVDDAMKEIVLKPDKDGFEDKKELDEYLKRVVFPDRTPGFDFFDLIDSGFVARTHRYSGEKTDFVFFDTTGRELKRKALRHTGSVANGRLFAFHEGAYLYLRDNIDQEVWELVSEAVF